MKKRLLYRLMPLLSLFLLSYPTIAKNTGNGKKVYADYHGIRRTRLYDGEFGEWKYASKMTYSPEKSGVTQLTYNPDLNILWWVCNRNTIRIISNIKY